jgi:hypothetical protein
MYKKSRHAANMKAGRVAQASVMMGCFDLYVYITVDYTAVYTVTDRVHLIL